MLRRILFIGGACLGMALMVGPALGARNVPKKANKYIATIVQGVEACTSANDTAPGALGTPACNPVVPSDPGCVFEDGAGKGQAKAKSKTDISIKVKLRKVDPACNGETLCAVASVITAQNNCGLGDCTTEAQVDLPLGIACCTVVDEKCDIKTTVNTALPGALVTGNSAEFQLGEVGLLRVGTPDNSPNRQPAAFRAGLLLE